jgi:hypothetical protein
MAGSRGRVATQHAVDFLRPPANAFGGPWRSQGIWQKMLGSRQNGLDVSHLSFVVRGAIEPSQLIWHRVCLRWHTVMHWAPGENALAQCATHRSRQGSRAREKWAWLRPSRVVRPPAKHWRGMARWPALATLTILGKKPHKMDYITGAHTQRCPRSFVIPHSQREWPEGVHERIRRNPGSLFSLFAPVQHSPQKMGTGSGQAINTLTLRGLAGACTHFFSQLSPLALKVVSRLPSSL